MKRTYQSKSLRFNDDFSSVHIATSKDFDMKDDPPLTAPITTDKARAGVTGHHVRYVLGISLALVVVGMLIMALWSASP